MNELMSPDAIAERKRIQDALRRIAGRYQDQCSERSDFAEVVVRRAIEEIFEAPVPRIGVAKQAEG